MKINEILKKELIKIKPSEKEEASIKKAITKFIFSLNKNLKKIKAKAIVGGSFAKGTTIKKDSYDVDVFVLFSKKMKNISALLEKVLHKMKVKAKKLPGSRDYFSTEIKADKSIVRTEIVPVLEIKAAHEAENVTDVSPLHINYIERKIKSKKNLADEIRLAKAFCYAQGCYGAESHIKGFSGYCLEVLTCYFGSFLSLLRSAQRWKKKVVIDPEKHYKNKDAIFDEVNEAKLLSPLVLIDPVQKSRNVAAALNKRQFDLFAKASRAFLKAPSKSYFEKKEVSEKSLLKEARKKKASFFVVRAESEKKKEDIAGAKLLKLYNLLQLELKKEGYWIKSNWFFKGKKASLYFIIKKPLRIVQKGPFVSMKEHAERFKKRWKKEKTFIKAGRIAVVRKPKNPEQIFALGKGTLEDMGISAFKVEKKL